MKVLEYIGPEPMCSGERMLVDPDREAESVLELVAEQWDPNANHWKILIEEDPGESTT